jgi:RimJ/RimL family protein N-acetyltransferase
VRLLFGHDQIIADWVARNIPHMATGFGPATAIGVVDQRDQPMAGVVFHDYQPAYGTIQLSAAAISPRWATKRLVSDILRYPFGQLGVHKVWTATQHENARALKFNEGVGFTREATLRDHFGPGVHAVICRMLMKDYRRIYG